MARPVEHDRVMSSGCARTPRRSRARCRRSARQVDGPRAVGPTDILRMYMFGRRGIESRPRRRAWTWRPVAPRHDRRALDRIDREVDGSPPAPTIVPTPADRPPRTPFRPRCAPRWAAGRARAHRGRRRRLGAARHPGRASGPRRRRPPRSTDANASQRQSFSARSRLHGAARPLERVRTSWRRRPRPARGRRSRSRGRPAPRPARPAAPGSPDLRRARRYFSTGRSAVGVRSRT